MISFGVKKKRKKEISVMTSVVWEPKLETLITGDCHSSQARMIRCWHSSLLLTFSLTLHL